MNQKQIEHLDPGGVLWDSKVKGLHVRANQKGKSYFLYYRFEGKQRRPKIGSVEYMSLDQARSIAIQWLGEIELGIDPTSEPAVNDNMTVGQWFELSRGEPKTAWDHEFNRLYRRHIDPAFGSVPMADLEIRSVKEWHASKCETPYEANRALSVLSALYGAYPERVFNPCTKVKRFPERARDRVASREEIRALNDILEREEPNHPHEVAYIRFLLYTGCRPEIVETFTSDMLESFDGKRRIRFKGKSGWEEIQVPKQALISVPEEGKLIPTTLRKTRNFWESIRSEIGAEDLWLRDMRRTFGTAGLSNGTGIGQIGELLNHRNVQTTKRYAKLRANRRAETAEEIADSIEDLLG